mmetsp:Transcript_32806/g.77681  ORF Transcript_32806/g.77681 Transcript_32806/m.77681 type:complete len:214 (-) Transcript_32806:77-718(-)
MRRSGGCTRAAGTQGYLHAAQVSACTRTACRRGTPHPHRPPAGPRRRPCSSTRTHSARERRSAKGPPAPRCALAAGCSTWRRSWASAACGTGAASSARSWGASRLNSRLRTAPAWCRGAAARTSQCRSSQTSCRGSGTPRRPSCTRCAAGRCPLLSTGASARNRRAWRSGRCTTPRLSGSWGSSLGASGGRARRRAGGRACRGRSPCRAWAGS